MMRWIIPVVLLSLSAGAETPVLDLDVAVPPGTPIEWSREIRQPVPTGRGAVPMSPDDAPSDPGRPRETSDGEKPRPSDGPGRTVTLGLDFGATDPFAYARVLTQDIAGHLQWVIPTPGTTREDVPTGGGADQNWAYPPLPSDTLYWYVLAVYLRRMIHPGLVSESECLQFLIEMGEPALIGAESAKNEPSCASLIKAVKEHVTPLPTKVPEVREGKSAVESMMWRLATEELTSGYPYELNPYFAHRTLSMGPPMFPILAELARDKHAFLRRNATAVLANVPHREAADVLVRLAKQTDDPVVRNRAVGALIRRRHLGAVDPLVSCAKGNDKAFRCYALYGLGLIGDKKATSTILEAATKGVDEPDVLWAAIPALARLKDNRADVRDFLKGQEERLRGLKTIFDEKLEPGRRWTINDLPGTKARVIWEMCVLALAHLGEADWKKNVYLVLDEGRKKPRDPRTRRSPSVLGGFSVPTHYLLLEFLAGDGADGRRTLLDVIRSTTEDPVVRLYAFMLASAAGADVKLAKELATGTEQPPTLRAHALPLIAMQDAAEAAKIARDLVLAGYASGKPSLPDPRRDPAGAVREAGESFVIVTSMQILGAMQRNDPDQLIAIIDRALAEAEEERKRPKPPKPDHNMLRWYQRDTVVVRAPILETAIHELGRTRQPSGIDKLRAILKDPGLKVGRAEAALALGAIKTSDRRDEIAAALLDALDDPVGWVRWCASRSLSQISSRDVACDWIYGGAKARMEASLKWREAMR